MNREEAAKTLGVSLPTIDRWRKDGTLKAEKKPSGPGYIYDDDQIFAMASEEPERITVAYARVPRMEKGAVREMNRQLSMIGKYCEKEGIEVGETIKDFVTGFSQTTPDGLARLVRLVSEGCVHRVVVSDRTRMSCVYLDLLEKVFAANQCKVVVVDEDSEQSLAGLLYSEEATGTELDPRLISALEQCLSDSSQG